MRSCNPKVPSLLSSWSLVPAKDEKCRRKGTGRWEVWASAQLLDWSQVSREESRPLGSVNKHPWRLGEGG